MKQRLGMATGIFMFGIGLIGVARGWYGIASVDFAISGFWIAWNR